MLELVEPGCAAALAALKSDTFVETFGPENDADQVREHVDRHFTSDAVRRSLGEAGTTTWWLVDGGVPIGYLKVNRGDAQTEPDLADGLEVEQLYVRAEHHGRGLGGRLLEHAISTARDEGFPFVWLGVWERNQRAVAVYEHLGFTAFGDHTFLFGDEEQRDVLMRLDLTDGAARADGAGGSA